MPRGRLPVRAPRAGSPDAVHDGADELDGGGRQEDGGRPVASALEEHARERDAQHARKRARRVAKAQQRAGVPADGDDVSVSAGRDVGMYEDAADERRSLHVPGPLHRSVRRKRRQIRPVQYSSRMRSEQAGVSATAPSGRQMRMHGRSAHLGDMSWWLQ